MSKRTTPAIILGIIALIFGIDTILEIRGGNQATISYWFYSWLHTGWLAPAIFFTACIILFVHFWTDGRNTPKP